MARKAARYVDGKGRREWARHMGKEMSKEAAKEKKGEGERGWTRQMGKLIAREAAKGAATTTATTAVRVSKDTTLEITYTVA